MDLNPTTDDLVRQMHRALLGDLENPGGALAEIREHGRAIRALGRRTSDLEDDVEELKAAGGKKAAKALWDLTKLALGGVVGWIAGGRHG